MNLLGLLVVLLGASTGARCAELEVLASGQSATYLSISLGSGKFEFNTHYAVDRGNSGLKLRRDLEFSTPLGLKLTRKGMNGDCELIMQEDGNLCIYQAGGHVWDARIQGEGCRLLMDNVSGEVYVKDKFGKVLWQALHNHTDDH
ncbi:hypothetical protein METEAL_24680 [Mesoterricola silvestris]|uniref:Bulb-type lectin domain-containing protein n=1 Tax=Mesoterricola silvestris TaxID=2927979 RepID=A0AA48K8U2_9BACT|nr:hypothetical protein METEAL_24680 [Mesoterricola silvestris]